ncbi:MAG: hypothetical protein ABIE22_05620 [archaeon]
MKIQHYCRNCERPFVNGDMVAFDIISGEAHHFFPSSMALKPEPEFKHLPRMGIKPCSARFLHDYNHIADAGIFFDGQAYDPSELGTHPVRYRTNMYGIWFVNIHERIHEIEPIGKVDYLEQGFDEPENPFEQGADSSAN